MSGVKGEVKSRGLIVTLCVLMVAMVGLIVGNVVVKVRREEAETVAAAEAANDAIIVLGGGVSDVNSEMLKMLEAENVDFDAINEMVDNEIDKALAVDGAFYIIGLLTTRTDAFLEKGYEREALDAVIQSEQTGRIKMAKADRHRVYRRAFELAEKLGDKDAMAMFQNLMNETEEAYIVDYDATEKTVENDNKIWEDAKDAEI